MYRIDESISQIHRPKKKIGPERTSAQKALELFWFDLQWFSLFCLSYTSHLYTIYRMKRLSFFTNVHSDRDFRATTGLSKDEFYQLKRIFAAYYSPNALEGIPEGFGRETVFQQADEALFFLLYYHKTAVTYDVLALNFGVSRAAAHTTVASLKPILKQVLHHLGMLPKRIFQTQAEVDDYFAGVADLSIDATEMPTQGPANEQEQEARYSKKNINIASRIL